MELTWDAGTTRENYYIIMEEERVEVDAAKAAALVRDKLLSKSNDSDWENMNSSVEGEEGKGLTKITIPVNLIMNTYNNPQNWYNIVYSALHLTYCVNWASKAS